MNQNTTVWMCHGDRVARLPDGFRTLASSKPSPIVAMADDERRNFVLDIAGCAPNWQPASIVEKKVRRIREQVEADGEVLMGLSGGVDSSVASVLTHQAIGDRLHCVFVDNGLLRQGEKEGVEGLFRDEHHMDLKVVDASERFLEQLRGVTEPEHSGINSHIWDLCLAVRPVFLRRGALLRYALGEGWHLHPRTGLARDTSCPAARIAAQCCIPITGCSS